MGARRGDRKLKNTTFNAGMYVRAYVLARQGLRAKYLAEALGTTLKTLKAWKRKYPYFKLAIDEARNDIASNTKSFVDYVHENLSPELTAIWDKIIAWEDEKNGILKIEKMLAREGMYVRMHIFLYALVNCNFNVSRACKKANINLKTFDRWCVQNPDFAQLVGEIHIMKKDFFEDKLVELVGEKDTSAVIFANKTFNRDRGYNDRVEIDLKGGITQTHLIDISVLELPPDVKRQILEAWRKHKQGVQQVDDPKTQALEYKRVGDKAIPVQDNAKEKEHAA